MPTTPLPNEPGRGMWQVGLRYDSIDLDDGALRPGATPTAAPIVDGILGGEMDSWTVGVNWYWRSNFKFMLNYVKVDSSQVQQQRAHLRRGRPEHRRSPRAVLLVIARPRSLS